MKWKRRSPHSIQSGELIISRARVRDGEVYTLWRGMEAVSRHDTAEQAKRAAGNHKGA